MPTESQASIGYGSRFQISSDGGINYTDMAEVVDITPPNETADVIDVTHMQSPDKTREFIEGLKDPGEVSFTINFVPGSGTDVTLRTMVGRQDCRITFPNGYTWTFRAFKTGYEPEAPNEDKMAATVTMKVTSTITGA